MNIRIYQTKTEYESDIQRGESLLDAIRKSTDIAIAANCGGKGICGKCEVKLISGRVMTESGEKEAPMVVRACRSYPLSDCGIEIMSTCQENIALFDTIVENERLGIAVDLGTTNITAVLTNGSKIYSEVTQKNRQSIYGADVMTRIENATEGKAKELQMIIKRQIADMVNQLLTESRADRRIEKSDIKEIVVSCNTTMEYLLLGWDASTLGQAPYSTRELALQETTIADIKVRIMPGISAFVGGDIVSGIAYLNIIGKSEKTFFLDLGTNGEMAVWTGEKLITTSVPAGPAFESGHVLYGSQLLDCAWEKLCEGSMEENGYLTTQCEYQDDIRTLQMAKAATFAGIKCLLQAADLSESDIDSVVIAGTFGEYLSPEAAIGIGMLPNAWLNKIRIVGNASLKGAIELVANEEMVSEAESVRMKAESLTLAESKAFSEIYINSMNFPKVIRF